MNPLFFILIFTFVNGFFNCDGLAETKCEIEGDLLLQTHYQKGIGPKIGGTEIPDAAELLNLNAENELKANKKFVAFYKNNFPQFNHYISDRWDTFTYPKELVQKTLENLCLPEATPVHFIQLDKEVQTVADIINAFKPNSSGFQVLHALVFRNNLFSLIIPPHWNSAHAYTAIINGLYSLNQNMFEYSGTGLFKILNQSYQQDSIGAVGILWNGGGGLGTITANDKAYIDFNDFMKIVIPALHLHTAKAISYGGSRGGGTAINLAAHPAVDQLRFAFTYAVVPPADLDFITGITSPTVPGLLNISDWITGFQGSWRRDFVMPDGINSGIEQELQVLVGSVDSKYIQQNINLTAPKKINKLRKNKTSVFLELGSHDSAVPFISQYKLLQSYRKNKVLVEARINYLGGHYGYAAEMEKALLNAILILNRSVKPLKESFVTVGKKQNYRAVADSTTAVIWQLPYAKTPLEIEFPKLILAEVPAHILITGEPGQSYLLEMEEVAAPEPKPKSETETETETKSKGQNKEIYFTIAEDGTAVLDLKSILPTSNMPVSSSLNLRAVYELDSHFNKKYQIKYLTSLKNSPPIELLYYHGVGDKDPRYWGSRVTEIVFSYLYDSSCSLCYVPTVKLNYGILEVGREQFMH